MLEMRLLGMSLLEISLPIRQFFEVNILYIYLHFLYMSNL